MIDKCWLLLQRKEEKRKRNFDFSSFLCFSFVFLIFFFYAFEAQDQASVEMYLVLCNETDSTVLVFTEATSSRPLPR